MNRLVDWSKRHEVAAFLIVTFMITWGLGLSWNAIIQRQQFLWLPLAFAATCGPGIAGILISAVSNTERGRRPRRTFWSAFVVAWLVSLLVSLANSSVLQQSPLTPMSVSLFAVAVLPVAFVVASAWSRNPSVRNYLASLVRFRGMHLPLFVRISATDWTEGGWDITQSVALARLLKPLGVDMIDCSSGGNVATATIPLGPGYQVPFAEQIHREASVATGAVGLITAPAQAEEIVLTGQAEALFLAREFLRDPYFPLRAARELGQDIAWPAQYLRAGPKGAPAREPRE